MKHLEICAIKRLVFFFTKNNIAVKLTENSLKNGRSVWNTDFDFTTFINNWTGAEQGFRKCEYRFSVRPDEYRTLVRVLKL